MESGRERERCEKEGEQGECEGKKDYLRFVLFDKKRKTCEIMVSHDWICVWITNQIHGTKRTVK